MVLCKFYQQGNCRFGTKCNNEHFDVKSIIKTDVEAAVNGKQWPFSSYGPFKDKPCIPNFIEDQSVDEVRYLCYESKKNSFFDQFHQQFNKEALEATGKMKALLHLNPELVEIVAQLYDTPAEQGSAKSANPFATTPGAPGSIFATANTAIGAGNIFTGGFSNQQTPGNFLAGGLQNTAASGNIFGGGSGANIFQTASGQQYGNMPNSIFAQQPAKPNNSILGGGTQMANPFQQTQPMGAIGGNLFAPAMQQLDIFTQAAPQTTPMYGQNIGQQQPLGGGNIFTQAAQPTQITTVGGGGFFAPQSITGNNLFAQAAAQLPQQQSQSSMFAQSAQPFQAQPAPKQPAQPTGFFQPAAMPMQQQQPQHQQPQQQHLPVQPLLPPPIQADMINAFTYSRLVDLTPKEIEAFQADSFLPGQIPCCPPPRELVNRTGNI